MKTVLFLGHSNNDVDHFLPLMVKLEKKDDLKPLLFCIPSRNILLVNKVHQLWIKDCSIYTVSANSVILNSIFQNILFTFFSLLESAYIKIANLAIRANFSIERNCLIFIRKLFGAIKLTVHILLNHSLNGKDCVHSLEKFFKDNSVACVVCDSGFISCYENEQQLVLKIRHIIIRFANARKIPIVMMNHGVSPKYEEDSSLSKSINRDKYIQPDVIIFSFEKEVSKKPYIGKNTKILILGDLRLDVHWIRSLEESAQKLPEYHSISTREKVILYLVCKPAWINDYGLLNSIHADIYNVVKKIEGLTLWIKLHPRYPFAFPLRNYTGGQVRIFGNEVDTNMLLPKSDIVISSYSGVLVHPMLMRRSAIFYDKIRAVTGISIKFIFDDTDCVEKVANPHDLEKTCRMILKRKSPNFDGLEHFYKKFISGGIGMDQSISGSYEKELLSLMQL
ncbi:MAG: hypothetical protein CMD96_06735 [Gammaproteobacteria bacterium]|nr:hypothetical protein [Gammaproteobacteria bacterium]HJP19817.1 CDP-glycerol glycerophosphotransferase family protein [Nitrospinota bacterium]|tara:strand:- start:26977 stop:28326 length:1350 start_codon:yes stop_codon:yes gene_type:complete